MTNWSDPAYRAFANWNYKNKKKGQTYESMECRPCDNRFGALVIYVYKNPSRHKDVKIGKSGSIEISIEDMLEWIEVVKHARQLMEIDDLSGYPRGS